MDRVMTNNTVGNLFSVIAAPGFQKLRLRWPRRNLTDRPGQGLWPRQGPGPIVIALVIGLGMAGGPGAAAEERVWLKGGGSVSGAVKRSRGETRVSWPFGSVSVPDHHVRDKAGDPEAREPGSLRAWTRGVFSMRYELVQRAGRVAPQWVKVRVKNETRLVDAPSRRLTRHEEVHRDINRAEARRIESLMARFETESQDLKQAEAAFRKKFHDLVRDVDRLHRDWDANHAVP
jgi:hypothetical protein